MEFSRKQHWETVYETKTPDQVSWTQEVPASSLELIAALNLPRQARIIDIGGGDSKLVDCLLDEGYQDITVLDISEKALEKAKTRLGDRSGRVTWIVSDILDFEPDTSYDLWHDRAAFHFLTTPAQVSNYVATTVKCVTGSLVLGTFSVNGPLKCSGLEIAQYDEETITQTFEAHFKKIHCITKDHVTPFNTVQNFLFCSFRRK